MKIPESIRIGGVDYEVHKQDTVIMGNQLCNGRIDFERSLITLRDDIGTQFQGITLWHEILHGIINHSEAELGISEEREEHVIRVLSRGIYQVLQDNISNFYDVKSLEEVAEEKELEEVLKKEKPFKMD